MLYFYLVCFMVTSDRLDMHSEVTVIDLKNVKFSLFNGGSAVLEALDSLI